MKEGFYMDKITREELIKLLKELYNSEESTTTEQELCYKLKKELQQSIKQSSQ